MAYTTTQLKAIQEAIAQSQQADKMNQTREFVQSHNPNRTQYTPEVYQLADMIKNQRVYKNAFGTMSGLTYNELGIDPDYGNSRFDKRIVNLIDAQNVNNFRSQEQSGIGKIFNGVGQSVVRFGTSAAETFNLLGLGAAMYGLQRLFSNNDEQLKLENQNYWLNNEFTRGLADLTDWSQKAMPVYRTDQERNDHNLFHNLPSAGWWGEDVISNFGFTLGAMVGGKSIGKLFNSTVGKLFNQTIAKMLNVEGEEAVQAFMEANRNATAETIQRALKQANNTLRAKNLVSTSLGIAVGAMSEANMEAVENYRNFLTEHQQHLQEYWNPQSPEAKLEYNLAVANKSTNLSLEEYCDEQYRKNANMALPYANQILRRTFALESALLTATNAVAFRNWYDVSFNQSKLVWNKIKSYVTPTIDKDTKLLTDIKLERTLSSRAKQTLRYLKPFISESFEEIGQAGISEGLRQYYGSKLNKDYRDNNIAVNPAYMNRTLNVVEGIMEGMSWMQSPSALMEGFIGGFTGLIGLPARTMSRAQRKAQNLKYFDKNTWEWRNGIWGTIKEIRDEKALAKNVVTEMQKIINDKNSNIADIIRTWNVLSVHQDVQNVATILNDKKAFLDSQTQTFLALAQMYDQLGMGDEFEELFDVVINAKNNANEKESLIDLIKHNYNSKITSTPNTEDVQKHELTDIEAEQILDSVIKHAEQSKKDLHQYHQLTKQTLQVLGTHLDINDTKNRQFVNIVINKLFQLQKLEQRQKELEEDAVINEIFKQYQKTARDIEQLRNQIQNDTSLSIEERQQKLKTHPKLTIHQYLNNILPILQNSDADFENWEGMVLNQLETLSNIQEYLIDNVAKDKLDATIPQENNTATSQLIQYVEASTKLRDWYLNDKEIAQLTKHSLDLINGIVTPEQVEKQSENYINQINNVDMEKKYQLLLADINDIKINAMPPLDSESYVDLMRKYDKIFQALYQNQEGGQWAKLKELVNKKEDRKYVNSKLRYFYFHFWNNWKLKNKLNFLIKHYSKSGNHSKVVKLQHLLNIDAHQLDAFLQQQIQDLQSDSSDIQDWKDIKFQLQSFIDNAYLSKENLQKNKNFTTTFTQTQNVENTQTDEVVEEVDYVIPVAPRNSNVSLDTTIQNDIDKIGESLVQAINAISGIYAQYQNGCLIVGRTDVSLAASMRDGYEAEIDTLHLMEYDLYNLTCRLHIQLPNGSKQVIPLENINIIDFINVKTEEQLKHLLESIQEVITQSGIDDAQGKDIWSLKSNNNILYPFIQISQHRFISDPTDLLSDEQIRQNFANKLTGTVSEPQLSAAIESGTKQILQQKEQRKVVHQYIKQLQQVLVDLAGKESKSTSTPTDQVNTVPGCTHRYSNTAIQQLENFKQQFPIGNQLDFSNIKTALTQIGYLNQVADWNTADDLQHWAKELGFWITFSDKTNAVIDNITFYEQQDAQPLTLKILSNLKFNIEKGFTFDLIGRNDDVIKFHVTKVFANYKIAEAISEDGEYVMSTRTDGLQTKLNYVKRSTKTSQHTTPNAKEKTQKSIVGISQYDTRRRSTQAVLNDAGESYFPFDKEANRIAIHTETEASNKWKRNPLFYKFLQALFNKPTSTFSVYEYYGTGQFQQDLENNPTRPIRFRTYGNVPSGLNIAQMYQNSTIDKKVLKKTPNLNELLIECYWDVEGQEQILGYLDPIDNADLIEHILKNGLNFTTTFEKEMLRAYESVIYLNESADVTQSLNEAYRTQDDGYTAKNGKQPQLVMMVGDNIYSNVLTADQKRKIAPLWEGANAKKKGVVYLIPYESSNWENIDHCILHELKQQSYTQLDSNAKATLFPFLETFKNTDIYNNKTLFDAACKDAGIGCEHAFYASAGHIDTQDEQKGIEWDRRITVYGDLEKGVLEFGYKYQTKDGQYHFMQGQDDTYIAKHRLQINLNTTKPEEVYSKIQTWLEQLNPIVRVDVNIFKDPMNSEIHERPNGNITLKGLISQGCLQTRTAHIYCSNATAQIQPLKKETTPDPKILQKAQQDKKTTESIKKRRGKSVSSKLTSKQRDLLSQTMLQQPEVLNSLITIDGQSLKTLHKFVIDQNNYMISFVKDGQICFSVNTTRLGVVQNKYLPMLGSAIKFYQTNSTHVLNLNELFAPQYDRRTKTYVNVNYNNEKTQQVLELAQAYAQELQITFASPENKQNYNVPLNVLTPQTSNTATENLNQNAEVSKTVEEEQDDTNTLEEERIIEQIDQPIPATGIQKSEIINDIARLITQINSTDIPDLTDSNNWDQPWYNDSCGYEDANYTFNKILTRELNKPRQGFQTALNALGYEMTPEITQLIDQLHDFNQTAQQVCE